MKFNILAAAVFAATLVQPASAQEAAPFTGFHAGVEGGWTRVGGGKRTGSDGFIYGGSAGYDFSIDKVRIGPDIEITGSTQKVCYPIVTGGVAGRTCQRTDRDLYAGARLGYVVAPEVMLYGKVGYSNARYGEYIDKVGWRASDHDGYRIGAGVEYDILGRFFVNGEYRYSHYKQDIHQNQVLAGVGMRF